MNKAKDGNTVTKLVNILKISVLLLFGIMYLHGVFSKSIKHIQIVFTVNEIRLETSWDFYEEELQIEQ